MLLTWFISLVFNAAYSYYRLAFGGNENYDDYEKQQVSQCHASTTYYGDWFIAVQLVVDLSVLGIYVYVLKLCRSSRDIVSSMNSLDKHGFEETLNSVVTYQTRLSGRDMAARALSTVENPIIKKVPCPLKVEKEAAESTVTESVSESEGQSAPAYPTGSSDVDDNNPTDTAPENFDPSKHRRSVTFTTLALNTLRTPAQPCSSAGQSDSSRNPPTILGSSSAIIYSEHGRSLPTPRAMSNVSNETWPLHVLPPSILPLFLIKSATNSSYRSEFMAAQQLGMFLLVQIACYHPALVTRLVASFMANGASAVSGFVHWLDWLALCRACLFPFIYWLYSARLREHCYWHFCLCRCNHKNQVAPGKPKGSIPLVSVVKFGWSAVNVRSTACEGHVRAKQKFLK